MSCKLFASFLANCGGFSFHYLKRQSARCGDCAQVGKEFLNRVIGNADVEDIRSVWQGVFVNKKSVNVCFLVHGCVVVGGVIMFD